MNDDPESIASARSTASRLGQVVDKYRVIRLIGEGGMGAVFEAQHTMIGRRVALKFLQPALASSTEMLARFRREAQAAGALEHENIAAVTDFGFAADGSPYMAIEYLDGDDLSRLLAREGPLPVQRAVYIVIQACRGLDAAHGRGVIHRDLKPENLFLCERADGTDLVKILDFGIAKLRDPGGGATTRTGATMGTPYYMSIEQARGAKDVDHRTDVYALGVILYELLSGCKPHPGESYNEIMFHILSKPVVPLDSLRPGLPTGLSEIVHRVIASEPGHRPSSAAELARMLAPFAGRVVTPLRSQAVLPVAGSADATVRGSDAMPRAEPDAPLESSTSMGTAVTGAAASLRRRNHAVFAVPIIVALVLCTTLAIWRPWRVKRAQVPGEAASAPGAASPTPTASSAQPVDAASEPPTSPARTSAATIPASGGRQPGRPPGHNQDAGSKPDAAASTEEPPPAVKPGKIPRPYDTNNPY